MYEKLSQRLRSAREERNLSQIEVAKATNINNKSLSAYERNSSTPDLLTLQKLADYYDISITWLLGIENNSGQHVYFDILERLELLDKQDIQSVREYIDFLEYRKTK